MKWHEETDESGSRYHALSNGVSVLAEVHQVEDDGHWFFIAFHPQTNRGVMLNSINPLHKQPEWLSEKGRKTLRNMQAAWSASFALAVQSRVLAVRIV